VITSEPAVTGYQTKAEVAATLIRQAIYSGRFAPGGRLVLRDLQAEFGLSITPIREALQQLQSQGLVTGEPHRGYRVAELRAGDVEEVYWLRSLLEPLACEIATDHLGPADLTHLRQLIRDMRAARRAHDSEGMQLANREFHMAIYEAAQRPVLLDHITRLWRDSPFGSLRLDPERPSRAAAEHTTIVTALAAGDAAAARDAMQAHLLSGQESVMRYLETHPTAR
jgi:DNA-binding GntR family transcriptional regulator